MIAASHIDGYVWVIVVVVVITVFGFVAAFGQREVCENRVLELFLLADRLRFDSFTPEPDQNFVLGWGFLSWFVEGSNRYASNILRGTYQGQQLFIFDYHYVTGSDRNTKDHDLTILMLVEKDPVFPQLTIGREKIGGRIAAAFGVGDEVHLESTEFSKAFAVHSKDKKFAYDVCNQQMMEYLLANRDLQIEIQGPVISIGFNPQLPVAQIESNLQRLAQIRSLLPEYLFTKETA